MADNRKHTRVVNIRKEAYDVYIGTYSGAYPFTFRQLIRV